MKMSSSRPWPGTKINTTSGAAQLQLQAPAARAFHESAVLSKNRLKVWGGNAGSHGHYHSGHYHSGHDMFTMNMLTGEWHQHNATLPYTPPPCEQACSCPIGNTIYSYGGEINYSPCRTSAELYKLNVEDCDIHARWERVETGGTKPGGRRGAGMCSANGKLLLMGGFGPIPSERNHPQAEYKMCATGKGHGWNSELFEFDPSRGCWSPVCVTGSKPSPRCGHTLTAVDENRAILFGGYDGHKHLNDLWLFDGEKKVWSHITPSSQLWPQPRRSHTVCSMMCDDQEIKMLLMGGQRVERVLDDCWLLDAIQGVGEKVMFDGDTFGPHCGHSAECVKKWDGKVVVSVFGGQTRRSLCSSTHIYKWYPHCPLVLCSCQAQARAVPLAQPSLSIVNPPPAGDTSSETRRLRKEVDRLTAITEQAAKDVYIGCWCGCPVAVKTLHKALAPSYRQRRVFEQEESICRTLRHPNIIITYGFIQQCDAEASVSLVMELLQASLADVTEAARMNDKYLTMRELTDVSRDCLRGLSYIHGLPRFVLHGDIRPTNILITSNMQAKLGDFGAARFTDGSLSSGPMSPKYVAPERLKDDTLPNSKEADVYSMGVSLYELYTGNQIAMDREVRSKQLHQKEFHKVCVKMAHKTVGKRMMASEALTLIDRVVEKQEYTICCPRRMVSNVEAHGKKMVTLCDRQG